MLRHVYAESPPYGHRSTGSFLHSGPPPRSRQLTPTPPAPRRTTRVRARTETWGLGVKSGCLICACATCDTSELCTTPFSPKRLDSFDLGHSSSLRALYSRPVGVLVVMRPGSAGRGREGHGACSRVALAVGGGRRAQRACLPRGLNLPPACFWATGERTTTCPFARRLETGWRTRSLQSKVDMWPGSAA